MSWTEDEIDELLVRYLDRELSLAEIEQIEQLLASDGVMRDRLSAWKAQRDELRLLGQQSRPGKGLSSDFANRIMNAACERVRELDDPALAPWISKLEAASMDSSTNRLPPVESDSILHASQRRRSIRRWSIGLAAMGLAASLLAMAFWPAPLMDVDSLRSKSNQVLSKVEQKDAIVPLGQIANLEKKDVVEIRVDADASKEELAAANKNPSRSTSDVEMQSKETVTSTIGMDLKPTDEQLKMLEGMAVDPNGMFLFVIDVTLPKDVADLDGLQRVLDRHDIASASELEIDESTQTKLATSRMIAEAGKHGLIADFVDPNIETGKSTREGPESQVVSLVFVKARGARLDAAIIDIMQQIEEYPAFSFDLAFDPPTHELMKELRFIQEANLPSVNLSSLQSVANVIRRSGKDASNLSQHHFAAGPRRSKVMDIETRSQSKLPPNAETMNPIAYALFIVRHAERESVR